MADPAVNNDFSANASAVTNPGLVNAAIQSNTDPVEAATAKIENALSSNLLNPVTAGDVRHVQATLNGLTPRDGSAVFDNLSDDTVATLAEQINDWRPGNLGGLSDVEKSGFFADMARQLDGAQLARLSEAFGGEKPGVNADVAAIGQAVADQATPNTKAAYVEALADRGLLQPGEQVERGFAATTTRQSSVYQDAALAVLGSLAGEASAFDRAVGSLNEEQLIGLIRAGLGATTSDPLVGFADTEYRADGLKSLQDVAQNTGNVETRARVMSRINTAIDGLQPRDSVVLQGGGQLEKGIVPSLPRSAAEINATRAELAQQNQLISELRATGTPDATALATRLETLYHGQEIAKLSADVYHWVGEGVSPSAPVGWTRASEDPATLARYGLTQEALAPSNSGFRAELYLPDPAIHGADAQPVLAFKGTTASSAEDWSNNFGQGTGNRTDYYDRAMALAVQVDRATDGEFELTGHSLGGGMASAGSAVTGADANTYNSAGLHPDTAAEFIARNGLGTPVQDAAQRVTVYQVDGEVLTTLQASASQIDPQRAEQIGGVVRFAAGVASNPFVQGQVEDRVGPIGDFGVLANAQGADLLSMAEAVGNAVPLDALAPDGNAPAQGAAEFVGPNGLATRADQILDRMDANIRAVDARAADQPWYAPPGTETVQRAAGRAAAYRQAYSEFRADPVFQDASAGLSESVARHGMDYVDRGLERALDALEQQADRLLGR